MRQRAIVIAVGLLPLALSACVSDSDKAREIVRVTCNDSTKAGLEAQQSGREDYGKFYWQVMISGLTKAAKVDTSYSDTLSAALTVERSLQTDHTSPIVLSALQEIEVACRIAGADFYKDK